MSIISKLLNFNKLPQVKEKSVLGWTSYHLGEKGSRENQNLYYGTVYSCIDAIAKAVSEVPFYLYKKGSNDEVENHPIKDLLNKPNQSQTATDFIYLIAAHIESTGSAYIYPVKSKINSKILELHLLNPYGITITTNQDNPVTEVTNYKYTKDGRIYNFTPEELIVISRPDPFNQAKGISTIQMARYDASNDLSSIENNESFYDNGASPSGVLSTDFEMNPEEFNRVKSSIKNQYTGGKNAYKLMFLTHGMKYSPVSPTQRDMQYIEQRKLNRDLILSIFQVPKSMLAISEQVNRATADAETFIFYKNVVKPRLELIFDKINNKLVPLFDTNVYFRFDDPIPQDQEFALKHKSQAVNNWLTVNEVRELEGYEPIEGGDELHTYNFMPPDEQEEEPEDQEEEEKKSIGHVHKELPPDPKNISNKKLKEYVTKRNNYQGRKEIELALSLNQHFEFLLKSYKSKSIKKDKLDDAMEWNDEAVFERIMPEPEQRRQWELLLLLLLLKPKTQVWKVNQGFLREIFDYKVMGVDPTTGETILSNSLANKITIDNLTASRINLEATKAAKSITTTQYKMIKKEIARQVASGERNLSNIKKQVGAILADKKQWKADQIAQTELAKAFAECNKQTYIANGIKNGKWLCGSDPCEICRQNCGQVRPIGQAHTSGHESEPVHCNCKCMLVPVL